MFDIRSLEILIEELMGKYFFNEKYHTLCSVVLVRQSVSPTEEEIQDMLLNLSFIYALDLSMLFTIIEWFSKSDQGFYA